MMGHVPSPAPPAPIELVARDLHYAHPARPTLLSGASLRVALGENVAIVGPSGSGKTTLLALLGGLLRPRQGSVRVAGVALEDPRDNVAWVLQSVNVLPDRTALDNVSAGAFADGLSRASAEVLGRDTLGAVGLAALAERPVRVLSGGELQRVVIARALASSRRFVLADEPTGQLDRATTDAVVDALLTTGAGRRGLVVVTHDPTVAARCHRTYLLRDGRLEDA